MSLLGRPTIYFHRTPHVIQLQIIRSLCISIFVIILTIVLVNLSDPDPDPIIKDSGLGESLSIEGKAGNYMPLNLKNLTNFTLNAKSISEINFKYVLLDPNTFTLFLRSFTNLRKLNLNHIKFADTDSDGDGKPWNFVNLNFNRVLLPKLEEFSMNLDIGFQDQYTEYMKKVSEELISTLLFYYVSEPDKDKGKSLGQKLGSEKVQVSLKMDGWSVLSILNVKNANTNQDAKEFQEIILGLSFADKILKDFNQLGIKIMSLTMTECLVSMSSIPLELQYLNLYRVNITEGDISKYFQLGSLKLKELYLEIRNATLNLSQIPKTVEILGIGDITDANYRAGEIVTSETVGLGFPLDVNIIENFHKIFTNLKKVGVFEPTKGKQHKLLKNILKTNASWVLLEGFERPSLQLELTDDEREVEMILKEFGVSTQERNFLLQRDERKSSSKWSQSALNKEQKLKFRYELLGWDKYITWESFSTNF